jgi:deoxyinosine 3'endonuclease (endonuclease V)
VKFPALHSWDLSPTQAVALQREGVVREVMFPYVPGLLVSVGHKIDLCSAVELVLATCRGYRIPEPTRQAHLHVNVLRRHEVLP